MFRGGQTNPYDDIVAKTTDENLTGENWELILNLCDKVNDEGEQGARNVIAAILKRLAHRNPNVQLYTLTLAEALTKNCNIQLHREIASRAFTQGLERLVTDRNTHDKVRRRALSLVAQWTHEFENDSTLGIMEECYDNLKNKGYKFETPQEAPPPEVDDEVRRREEEELQRVLEMSMHDKGGRGQWDQYSLASSSGAGSSRAAPAPSSTSSTITAKPAQQQPTYGGYVPSANPTVSASPDISAVSSGSAAPSTTISSVSYTASSPAPSTQSTSDHAVVTRVRALHTFEPTEAGELGFEKGDIIKVVDRGYKDWWRGQLKGRTGIFPVNYVEPLPEPTAAELAREAEQEAAVFNQAANVDRLLTMLRQLDPAKDNLADNDEIQELYRSCMSLRPKIVKLIDKYTQKRADLVSMNESFIKARTIFDRMMEDSLARHTAVYDGRPPYQAPYPQRPDSRAPPDYPPQAFGWNPNVYEQPGYNAYPAAPAAYAPGPGPEPPYPTGPVPQGFPDAGAYASRPQTMYNPSASYAPTPVPQAPYGVPSAGPGPEIVYSPHVGPQGQPPAATPVPQYQSAPPPQPDPGYPQPYGQPQPAPGVQPTQPAPTPHVQPELHIQTQPQPQPQAQVQATPIVQAQPQSQQSQPQVQPQPQAHTQSPTQQPQQAQQAQPEPVAQQQSSGGPPYVFDPNATYPDPNVQAWAQYYAAGGTDPTGSVYFISVPGVKEPAATKPTPVRSNTQDSVQSQHTLQQSQAQGQPGHDGGSYSTGHGGTAPLNVQQGQPGGAAPGSPSHQPPIYQNQSGPAGQPNTSTTSLPTQGSPQPQHQPAYGASPYGGPGFASTPQIQSQPQPQAGGDANAQWQAQYYGVQNQFANLSVGGEGGQGQPGPGPQGVHTPA
ncbi:hypothetical protein K474DRAFT_1662768 [Panus rudis PR-1116 ss-1]|nr:hypothetical protein K474DRAFT_1662768 [Panus rudis PR-1116 ss-1]